MAKTKAEKPSNLGTCKLCLKPGELCNSHIVPAGLYKLLDPGDDAVSNGGLRDPLYFANNKSYPWSKQPRQYLLCRPCEEILNKDETYVIPLLYKYDEPFKLLALMVPPSSGSEPLFLRTTPRTVDAPSISRFALGLMWRASIATIPPFDLFHLDPGPEEAARLHLLGTGPWPKEMVMEMAVFTGARYLLDLATMTLPQASPPDEEPTRHYFWMGHGIRFDFTVGANVPDAVRHLAFCGGPLSQTLLTHADTYNVGAHILEKFQTHTPSKAFGERLKQRFGAGTGGDK